MRCFGKILHISYKDHVTNEKVRAKIQQAIRPNEDLLMNVNRCKLQWYGDVSCSSGLAKTILQGTVKGGRRQGIQRKRWEDSIREWTGLEFGRSQRAVENRKMEKTGCKIICGAPTTLVVTGQMMMMMMKPWPTKWHSFYWQSRNTNKHCKLQACWLNFCFCVWWWFDKSSVIKTNLYTAQLKQQNPNLPVFSDS